MNRPTFKLAAQVILGLGALAFGSCATSQPYATVLATVGPLPTVKRVQEPGSLIVYTPIVEPNINPDTMFYPHSSYAIYDSHGAFFQNVRNHIGAWDETPSTVSLPAGRYTVKAETEFDGDVEVPVIIVAERTTVVDLQHRDRRSAQR